MTYGRYESRRGYREPRAREDESFDRSQWRDEDDRGFFNRAGDEIASWFGDDDARRRREMDHRDDDGYVRSSTAFGPDRDDGRFDRSPRFRDEGYRRPYTGRFMGRGFGEPGFRDRDDRFERMPREDRLDRGWSQREFTGQASGLHDPHYSEWRRRQIDSLDRDYDEYRRENEGRFENEFGQWRETRASKRQLLGTVREHMTVVGSDSEHVGTVDKVAGDRIVLTKSDSDDGRHHLLSCGLVERIEGDTVTLNVPAEEAKSKAMSTGSFGNRDRDRALFERGEERDGGPHMLNRSFSGTY